MKSAAAVLPLLLAAVPAFADALPERAVHVADYAIEVRLDAAARTLAGKERITWRNPSGDAVGEVWFHLYLNAFRNTESTFFRESGGQLRGDQMPEDGWGSVDVTSLRRADGKDLTKAIRFEHPDDDNDKDRTVIRVPLPEPVPPGGEVQLDVEWTSKLPRIFARTGYVRDYFLVGQWFPKLGVYEPAGLRGRASGGWNCHQFHANSEFYADFGAYRVSITLPSAYVVGATGRETEAKKNADGTTTHVFEQADVIDFAWTASPRFLDVRARFDAEKDVTPQEYAAAAKLLGRAPEEVKLRDVEVRVLLQPGHAPQAERHVAAAKNAIKWFGPGTPPPVSDADGRRPGARRRRLGWDGGSTFITAGTSFLMNRVAVRQGPRARGSDRPRVRPPVLAEHGHVERVRGVLARRGLQHLLDREGDGALVRPVDGAVPARAAGRRARDLADAERPGPRVRRGADERLGLLAGQLLLQLLRPHQADARHARVDPRRGDDGPRDAHVPRALPLSGTRRATTSTRRSRRSPAATRWFFDQTVERPGIVVDYEVASVRERVAEPRGILGDGPSPKTVGEREAAKIEREKDASGAGRPYRTTVIVRRRGEVERAAPPPPAPSRGRAAATRTWRSRTRLGRRGRGGEEGRAHGTEAPRVGHRRPRRHAGARREPPRRREADAPGRAGGRRVGHAAHLLDPQALALAGM
ncbi:MAG: hypothetical protein U0599_21655 [Vicinamibacteria bacterium]